MSLIMKGISPLIAGVLLIALTVTIAILVTAWTTSFTSTTQSGVGNKSTELVSCSGAAVDIEAVYLRNNENATVVVKNTGLINDIQITGAQIYLLNGTNTTASNATTLPITNFDRGNIVSISFVRIQNLLTCPGNFSQVVVQTGCPGAADTFDIKYETPTCA